MMRVTLYKYRNRVNANMKYMYEINNGNSKMFKKAKFSA